MKRERRFLNASLTQIRSSQYTTAVRGYAAVFDSLSADLGGFKERIHRDAFNSVMKTEPDVVALFNHDPNMVLGRTPKTLALQVDSVGLAFKLQLADTRAANDLRALLQRNDIRGCSFGFLVKRDNWAIGEGNTLVRTILDVATLVDIGPTTWPAYSSTTVRSSVPHYDRPFSSDALREIRAALSAKHTSRARAELEAWRMRAMNRLSLARARRITL